MAYKKEKYRITRWICRFLLRTIGFSLLARIDEIKGFENIPQNGPALLMINHIAFIDPLILVHKVNRDVIPLAKEEVYNYPFVGIFPKMWGVIPVKRYEFDRKAIAQAIEVLSAGEIVLVAPEGTRGTELKEGLVGIAYLASRAKVPIIPVAIDGTIGFPTLPWSRRWKQSGASVTIGKPFRYKESFHRARGKELRLMTDEAMYILASLLPEHRRGIYADLEFATTNSIEWI